MSRIHPRGWEPGSLSNIPTEVKTGYNMIILGCTGIVKKKS
jgi:hypothetical protein